MPRCAAGGREPRESEVLPRFLVGRPAPRCSVAVPRSPTQPPPRACDNQQAVQLTRECVRWGRRVVHSRRAPARPALLAQQPHGASAPAPSGEELEALRAGARAAASAAAARLLPASASAPFLALLERALAPDAPAADAERLGDALAAAEHALGAEAASLATRLPGDGLGVLQRRADREHAERLRAAGGETQESEEGAPCPARLDQDRSACLPGRAADPILL